MLADCPFTGDISLPNDIEQALRGPHKRQWQKVINSEIKSLRDCNVYTLVDKKTLPKNANIISAKWVFKVKPRADGSIE